MASKRRRGRPRKTGARHKNGHLKQKPADRNDSPRAIAARMPHRRGLGEQALDPAAESELGRMRLRGEVSEPECTAGEVFRQMWRGYVSTMMAPRAPGVAQGAISACAGCPVPESRKYCLCHLRRRVYDEAAGVIVSAGRGVSPVVHAVVILDRQCPYSSLELLKVGLTALAKHYSLLTSQPKRPYQKQRSEIVAPAK